MELILEYFEEAKDKIFHLSIESYVAFILCSYVQENRVIFKLVKTQENHPNKGVPIKFESTNHTVENNAFKSKLPIFITENILVSGLCGVSRRILKYKYNDLSKLLLGFKENCLMSPSEVSHWTSFCEREMVECVNFIRSGKIEETKKIPETLVKLERHLSNPIRIHNVYKVARTLENNPTIKSGVPVNIEHTFCHGTEMSLADFMTFAYFKLIFQILDLEEVEKLLPLVVKWFKNMRTLESIEKVFDDFSGTSGKPMVPKIMNLTLEYIPDSYFSLYKRELTGFRSKNRIYTDQFELDKALAKLDALEIDLTVERVLDYQEIDDSIVLDLLKNGDIPDKRIDKKKSQLKSLAIEVLKIAKPGDRIVDFCSGTGHLGLLLAHLLPNCQVTILENKEESINRAQQKARKSQLANIQFFQCNLEYFQEYFDIGISLHACGVATDIVLTKCFKKRASFVACPCCYGKIQGIEGILKIPQSKYYRDFSGITEKDFLYMAHCSDQTHDKNVKNCNIEKADQGVKCMIVVDTDRKLRAEELGYHVELKKLNPENCTPKNHVLIGSVR